MTIHLEASNLSASFSRPYDHWMAMFDLIWQVAEDVLSPHQSWDCDYTNKGGDDGPELVEQEAAAFHLTLSAANRDGRIRNLIRARDKEIAEIPNQPCVLCKPDEYETGEPQQEYVSNPECEVCHGKGELPPWEREIVITELDFVELEEFLAVCGGFSLHPGEYRYSVIDEDEDDDEEHEEAEEDIQNDEANATVARCD